MTIPSPADLLRRDSRSVVDIPKSTDESLGANLIWLVGSVADEIVPWGTNPTLRDRQLRAFFPTEPYLASGIQNLVARNQGFDWTLDGPPESVEASRDLLVNANLGRGWTDFVGKLSSDLLTQDKGAFIEVIRAADAPDAPVLGIQTLDAAHCWHTGNPEVPVLYVDRNGKWHRMKWYQVVPISEAPAPHELLYGLQYCAVTRILRSAQLMRNILVMNEEKTGGRFTKQIHLVNGFAGSNIQDAMAQAQENASNQGLSRYMQPVILGTNVPEARLEHEILDMATLPEGFDFLNWQNTYITVLALGLLVDYQELAPLPGGNLGTSTQSEILAAKGRGKSAEVWRTVVEHALNTYVLPEGVLFEFDPTDLAQDALMAENTQKRAETRATEIESGVLTPAGARQQAVDAGDITQELFDEMAKQDVAAGSALEDELGVVDITGEQFSSDDVHVDEFGEKDEIASVSPERRAAEAIATDVYAEAFRALDRRINKRMKVDA